LALMMALMEVSKTGVKGVAPPVGPATGGVAVGGTTVGDTGDEVGGDADGTAPPAVPASAAPGRVWVPGMDDTVDAAPPAGGPTWIEA
jgi:hypothetical protein